MSNPSTSATSANVSVLNSSYSPIQGITGVTTVTGTLASRITTLETAIAGSDHIVRLDSKNTDEQAFRLPWGKVVSIPHEELIKYIGERDLRESNELVRTLWDRYQTAVKLIWSENDEQET